MKHPNDPMQVCILWHAQGKAPEPGLIQSLIERGLTPTPASDRHRAFALACRCAKSAQRVVILLDDPESLIGVDRVLDALERFGPGVIFWEHHQGANPSIVPVVRTAGAEVRQEHSDPEHHSAHHPERGPEEPEDVDQPNQSASKLRLVGKEKSPAPTSTASLPNTVSKAKVLSSRDVLDADELDALLAGELGADQPRK